MRDNPGCLHCQIMELANGHEGQELFDALAKCFGDAAAILVGNHRGAVVHGLLEFSVNAIARYDLAIEELKCLERPN